MLLFLAAIANAQEPAAQADATITITKPHFAAPAPPSGRSIGVGMGYYLGWSPVTDTWLPEIATITFRGPKYTWVPSLSADLSVSNGDIATSYGGGSGQSIDQYAYAGVSWYQTVTEPQPLSIRPTLCAGGSLTTAYDKFDTSDFTITTTQYVCMGMHVQRWLGSRFSADLDVRGISLGFDQMLEHSPGYSAQTFGVSVNYLPSATATVSMYFARAREKK